MFLVRYHDGNQYQVIRLHPGPTDVEYPERRVFNDTVTPDGAVVIQRPLRDSRRRQWVWKNYRPYITTYENQWKLLETLEVKTRLRANLEPTVQIWEDVTDEGGFGETVDGQDPDLASYSNLKWTTVRFVQVTRKTRKGGGKVVYDDSIVEFIVDDPNYDAF